MRIFFSDNGVIQEITKKVEQYNSPGFDLAYTAAQDYLYVGHILPFNNFFLKIGEDPNEIASTMRVDVWDGREWIQTVYLEDETNALSNSGHVTYVPNKDNRWQIESTNYKGEKVDGLESIVVYDLYWIRISFSVTLTADVSISFVGQKFSNDEDLFAEYPVLNSSTLLESVKTGKTDWEEQHLRAAEIIEKDLISKNVILSGAQILRISDYRLASVCKTAQIIFQSMGDDYADDVEKARLEYERRLDRSIQAIDRNGDGILDSSERFIRTGFLSR